MPSYFITGAGRGLGLAFTKELLQDPKNHVIASARNPSGSKGLQELITKYPKNQLSLVQLDVTDEKSIANAVKETEELAPNGIDNFISNAGIASDELIPFSDVDLKTFGEDLNFQLVATISLFRAFLPLIKKSEQKKVLVLTSVLGSIELGIGMPGLANTYSIMKAGLNMLWRKWAAELKGDKVTVVLIHPGWVGETDMGGTIGPYMEKYAPDVLNVPEVESATGCMKVLKEATFEQTGSFFVYDGSSLPW
ncbi:putative short-chain dehydrogenases/reductase [Microthyrium microscopicum]|uniref:Putative short-chain dehydrogenases/reductase n=1 Tax=Microthyrium microscopicum TaxID=703497 RepID=A0A6A6UNC5_9PEZI|nr:putative short-chain dehydrogenases/reductase [Microthyrium microscopicum]